MGDLFHMNVQLEPCVRPCEVLESALKAIRKGLQKNDGKMIFCFKVIGENRLMIVLEGDPDDPVDELNAVCGSQVRVTTTPLRKYEEFSEKILKVDDKELLAPSTYSLDGEGKLFCLHFVLEYKGMTLKDFLETWKREALTALRVAKTTRNVALFKVVGQREVYAFLRSSGPSAVDDLTFNLPLMVENGNQVHITVKAIRFAEETKSQ